MVALGQVYLDVAKTGVCTDDQRAKLFDAGRTMVGKGADAILLAGTDLYLAFAGHDPGYPVVDAVDVHVAVLADLAMDRRTIAEVGGLISRGAGPSSGSRSSSRPASG
jgi:aspartate racemase